MAITRAIVTAVTLFVFAVVLLPSNTNCYRLADRNSSSNLILGGKQEGDILLHSYHHTFHARRNSQVLIKDIVVPKLKKNGTIISYIRVINSQRNTQAYPKLIEGGLGYPNATIRLTSQRGRDLYYVITVYGLRQETRNQTTNSSDVIVEDRSADATNITDAFIISGNNTLLTNGSANATENIFNDGLNNYTNNVTIPFISGNETQFLNGSANSTNNIFNDGCNNYTNNVTFPYVNVNETQVSNGSANATENIFNDGFSNGSANATENIFNDGYSNQTNNVTFPYVSVNETQVSNGSANATENIFNDGYSNGTNNVTFPNVSLNETQVSNGSANATENIFNDGYSNDTNNVTFPYVSVNETQVSNGSANATENIFNDGYSNYTNNVTFPYLTVNEAQVSNGSDTLQKIFSTMEIAIAQIMLHFHNYVRENETQVLNESSSATERYED